MDAFKTAFRWTVFVLFIISCAATVLPPDDCLAGDPAACHSRHRRFFDGTTLCEWRRTWHGPNGLDRPLSGYFMPRFPDYCDDPAYAGCSEAIGEYFMAEDSSSWDEVEPADGCCVLSGMGLEPIGFERLGQIPNDLALAGELPAGGPARPGR